MGPVTEAQRRMAKLLTAQGHVDLDHAESMGYDCGKNGANETNCHFAIFSAPEFTKAWERGKARADAEKAAVS